MRWFKFFEHEIEMNILINVCDKRYNKCFIVETIIRSHEAELVNLS